ncbi:MAG: hypothetical protein WCJ18_12020 [Planctomycetota bacterium]
MSRQDEQRRLLGAAVAAHPIRGNTIAAGADRLDEGEGAEFPLECPGCGGDIRLIALHPSRGRSTKRPPAGAGPREVRGSHAGEGQDGFVRV